MIKPMTNKNAEIKKGIPGILTSDGCGSTTSNTLDAGVSGIISPTGTGCVTTITPIVTIQNIYRPSTVIMLSIMPILNPHSLPLQRHFQQSILTNSFQMDNELLLVGHKLNNHEF